MHNLAYNAVVMVSNSLNPYAFLIVNFALLLNPSTTPEDNPCDSNQFSSNGSCLHVPLKQTYLDAASQTPFASSEWLLYLPMLFVYYTMYGHNHSSSKKAKDPLRESTNGHFASRFC